MRPATLLRPDRVLPPEPLFVVNVVVYPLVGAVIAGTCACLSQHPLPECPARFLLLKIASPSPQGVSSASIMCAIVTQEHF
jgi:hypothetical protein